jgi:hypothetical protein
LEKFQDSRQKQKFYQWPQLFRWITICNTSHFFSVLKCTTSDDYTFSMEIFHK